MIKLLRNTLVLVGAFLYFSHVTTINPDFPLFLLLFGLPFVVIYTMDNIDFKKVQLFLRVSSKYGLVLSSNLYKSLKFNLVQYRQVVSRRMSEY